MRAARARVRPRGAHAVRACAGGTRTRTPPPPSTARSSAVHGAQLAEPGSVSCARTVTRLPGKGRRGGHFAPCGRQAQGAAHARPQWRAWSTVRVSRADRSRVRPAQPGHEERFLTLRMVRPFICWRAPRAVRAAHARVRPAPPPCVRRTPGAPRVACGRIRQSLDNVSASRSADNTTT